MEASADFEIKFADGECSIVHLECIPPTVSPADFAEIDFSKGYFSDIAVTVSGVTICAGLTTS